MTGLLPGPAELGVFAAAVFVLNLTPGVDSLLTVTRTLQRGAKAGIAAAAGIVSGCAVHTLAAAFGLAALLALHPWAFVLVQWAGAAYLAWLGLDMLWRAWRPRAASAEAAPAAGARAPSYAEDYRTGVLTNVLNPKVALFFLAFLPQFVPAGSPSKTLSFLLLGAWFIVQGFVYLLGLVALTLPFGRLRSSTTLQRVLGAAGGLLFIGLALRLLRARPTLA